MIYNRKEGYKLINFCLSGLSFHKKLPDQCESVRFDMLILNQQTNVMTHPRIYIAFLCRIHFKPGQSFLNMDRDQNKERMG